MQEPTNLPFSCPCCEASFDHWLDVNDGYRNVACPSCFSQPRHRALWLFLNHRSRALAASMSVLHIAPERGLWARFKSLRHWSYLTLDASMSGVDVTSDVTCMPFADKSFDLIICSHVLEHVSDDRAAMRELFRVLRPGGCAFLNVPMDERLATTLEDPVIQTPADRLRHYHQEDHLRLYGLDYAARLESVGFDVRVEKFVPDIPQELITRFKLTPTEDLYFGLKPATSLS